MTFSDVPGSQAVQSRNFSVEAVKRVPLSYRMVAGYEINDGADLLNAIAALALEEDLLPDVGVLCFPTATQNPLISDLLDHFKKCNLYINLVDVAKTCMDYVRLYFVFAPSPLFIPSMNFCVIDTAFV